MSDLKPCPFCGCRRCRVETDEHPDHRLVDRVLFVQCDDCGARGSNVAIRGTVDPDKTARILWDMREL